jgi:hypothetical protein
LEEAGQDRRRKRKRRLRRKERVSAGNGGTSRFGLMLFGLMGFILLCYCGLTILHVQAATGTFGPYALGMSQADVRYQFGDPQQADTDIWNYASAGSRISLGFGADGRLDRVTCVSEGDYQGPCPYELGVGIGSTESDLVRLLGPADTMHYDHEDKIVRYRGLGLMARLRKLRVVEIEHSRASSTLGMVKVALWRMLP